MYVSAAVLAAGAVAGVNTQNAHAAEVQKQADKNAAQKTIDQNQKDLTQTQDQLNKAQEDRDDAVRKVPDAQANVLPADSNNQSAQSGLANAQDQLKTAQDAQAKAQANYDASYENNVKSAQNDLKTAQDTANKAAETINNAQAKLNSDTDALNGAKSELSNKQKQASDLNTQRDQVAKDLQTAQNKMNTAKAELDADKDVVVNTMVMPQVYKDTVKKWSGKTPTDDYYKEMEAASWVGWTQNEYKHNEAEKNHMVDLKHMSRADQIELNKFGIDLINQLRSQIGVDPWTFNESALDFANAIADRYVKDDWDSDANHHDSAGINELAHQYGLRYTVSRKDGAYSKDGQYYENLMTDRFGWTELPFTQAKGRPKTCFP